MSPRATYWLAWSLAALSVAMFLASVALFALARAARKERPRFGGAAGGTHRLVIDYPPVRAHVSADGTFDVGRERLRLGSGEEINIYSPEQSVADAMRLRGQVGVDVAHEVLRCYLRRPEAPPGDLLRSARRPRTTGTHVRRSEGADGLSKHRTPQ